ncbi:restriction endonuclease subunit S [Stutzerimonas nitrititolerans]|uniref:restriction endonuclease subunit S n=1 Tax=Stutzerimonas nitrititolerans TaxID=2482751 RepID=UPI0035E3EABD
MDILSGFAFKSENFNDRGEGLPLVRIRDVVPGVSDTYYSGEYSSEFLLSDGDLLIGMDGDFNRARWSGGRALLNQRVCKITAKCESLDQGYLYHFLPKALDKIHAETPAVTVKHLSVKGIRAIEIPLPPLPEQKRIAAILDKADTIRRKRQQAIQLADDFLRAVFLDMFGDPVTNPKGWQTFTLAEVVRKDSIITYGIVQAGEHVDGGVPYIRTGDFKGGKLVRSGYACTSSEIASKFKRSEVSPGDIVYCIRASVGSADVVPDFLAGANLTQGTAKISPASDMKSEFLVELLRSAGFRSWIDKNSKGATFKEITLGRLREAPVFKPPLVEQEAFVRIKKIVMDRLAGKFRETDVPLFESLSQKAFCGEL